MPKMRLKARIERLEKAKPDNIAAVVFCTPGEGRKDALARWRAEHPDAPEPKIQIMFWLDGP